MRAYVIQRLLATIPVIMLVGIITFSLVHITPGDPATLIVGNDPGASPEYVEEVRHALGLDKPLIVQFGVWVRSLAKGDLGTSVFSKHSITSLMAPRLQPTLSLAALAVIMSVLIGIPLGVVAARSAGTAVDRGVMVFATIGFSVPTFWLGFLFIWAFAVHFRVFPATGYIPISDGIVPWLRSLTLPALVIALHAGAVLTRMTRSTMLEVLGEDYVRTARAKGLAEPAVYIRHALRNASLPIITVIGFLVAGMVTGTVVTEVVFTIPGLGRLIVDAVIRRDYPIVQAMLMIVAGAYLLLNLAVDIMYAYLDPRIRY